MAKFSEAYICRNTKACRTSSSSKGYAKVSTENKEMNYLRSSYVLKNKPTTSYVVQKYK